MRPASNCVEIIWFVLLVCSFVGFVYFLDCQLLKEGHFHSLWFEMRAARSNSVDFVCLSVCLFFCFLYISKLQKIFYAFQKGAISILHGWRWGLGEAIVWKPEYFLQLWLPAYATNPYNGEHCTLYNRAR